MFFVIVLLWLGLFLFLLSTRTELKLYGGDEGWDV